METKVEKPRTGDFGRTSVRLEIDQGNLVAAHIGGTAVIVSEGTLAL